MEIRPIPSFANETMEVIKDGNAEDDDDNWRFIVVGDRLVLQVKISGTWETARKFDRPL